MEHNVYVFPPFVLVGPLLRYVFDQRQCFAFSVIVPRLQRHRYWWAILQAMAVDSFLLGRKGDPAVLLFPSRTCPDFIATILDKSPWDSTAIFIFSVISRFPLKTVQRFRNFFAVLPPPPYTKLKVGKNSGYTRPTLFVGWGEGLDLSELENASEMQKCPKTFVHDCLIKMWEGKRQFWGVFKPVKVFFRDPDERW